VTPSLVRDHQAVPLVLDVSVEYQPFIAAPKRPGESHAHPIGHCAAQCWRITSISFHGVQPRVATTEHETAKDTDECFAQTKIGVD